MAAKTGPARELNAIGRAERCKELAQGILVPVLSPADMDTLDTFASEHPSIGAYIKFLIVGTLDTSDLLQLFREDKQTGMYGYLLAHQAVVEGEMDETGEAVARS
jgi:hypothetical protein